jgi:hypothetical protein
MASFYAVLPARHAGVTRSSMTDASGVCCFTRTTPGP